MFNVLLAYWNVMCIICLVIPWSTSNLFWLYNLCWTFDQPWKDLTLELTGSQKMEELHACQSLLDIISNVLGKGPPEVLVSATYDVDTWGHLNGKKVLLPFSCSGSAPSEYSMSMVPYNTRVRMVPSELKDWSEIVMVCSWARGYIPNEGIRETCDLQ